MPRECIIFSSVLSSAFLQPDSKATVLTITSNSCGLEFITTSVFMELVSCSIISSKTYSFVLIPPELFKQNWIFSYWVCFSPVGIWVHFIELCVYYFYIHFQNLIIVLFYSLTLDNILFYFIFYLFYFWEQVTLCNPAWPGTCYELTRSPGIKGLHQPLDTIKTLKNLSTHSLFQDESCKKKWSDSHEKKKWWFSIFQFSFQKFSPFPSY